MCTVTYIPPSKEHGFILTSNRDEKMHRETEALKTYHLNDVDVCFPKDSEKGGSWIAVNNKGRISCLLNGAFVSHKKQDFYKQSRGKVLIETASFKGDISSYFNQKDLLDVEPFTIINIEQEKGTIKKMYEFVWDGTRKHSSDLDKNIPKIWSSVTLYNTNDRELRNIWFNQFLAKNLNDLNPEIVYDFHSGSHTPDQSINLLMKRDGGLKTVSITQIIPLKDKCSIKYVDLLNSTTHQTKI